jgi:type IV pilus assembly protein PilM
MIDMLFRTTKEVFGLDIGSHSIKLVELKKGRKDYKLKTFGTKRVPKDTIIDGAVMDSVALADTIKALLAEHKPSSKFVALSVFGHSVIVKKINVPLVTEDELANSIQWETEQYLPFNIQDVYVDFKILGESQEVQGQLDVLLVAAKREVIDDYLLVVKEAGLEPLVVDIDVFAIQNMYELNYPMMDDKVVLLCNLGASFSNLNIVKGGISLFTRTINIGGNRVTEELQKNLGVTFDEAERVKLGDKSISVNESEVNEIIGAEIDNMSGEIQRTIDFFYNSNPNDVIEKIVLFGGTCRLQGLLEKLKEKVGIVVEIGNPFVAINLEKNQGDKVFDDFALQGAVAVGLAIRRLGDK